MKDSTGTDKKPKKRMRSFLKSLILTFLVFLVLVFSFSIYSIYRAVVPPEIPTMAQRDSHPVFNRTPSENVNESQSYANAQNYGEYIEDDPDWDDTLIAPVRFTDDDRRDNFFTFLIVGLNEGRNANTVMVASYDANAREAHLISIPRDSLINVNRTGRKLSSSYLAGAAAGRGREGGIRALMRDVRTVIGFEPDFYILIDYAAFHAIIDAVGGVEIYVPFHMRYTDPFQNLDINIQPGLQHMGGETALHFARFRRANSGFQSINDYQRIKNQQTVINAVISRLLRPQSIPRIPEFVDIFNEYVHTDLAHGNMLWFARELNRIRGTDALSAHTTPMLGTSGEPMWYEILNARGIVELVNNTINPFYRDIELRDVSIIRE